MKKIILSIVVVLVSSHLLSADVLVRQPEQNFVFDKANLFSSEQIVQLEKELKLIRDSSNAEVIVVSVDASVETEVKQYAEMLSNQWIKEGKLRLANILLILDPTDRKFVIVPSEELAKGIDVGLLKKIEDKFLLPETRNKKYYEGISNSIAQVKLVLAGELDKSALDGNYKGLFFFFVTFLVVFFVILFPVLVYKMVVQNHHLGSRKPGFFKRMLLANTFGSPKGGFAVSSADGAYDARKEAILRGAGGAAGMW